MQFKFKCFNSKGFYSKKENPFPYIYPDISQRCVCMYVHIIMFVWLLGVHQYSYNSIYGFKNAYLHTQTRIPKRSNCVLASFLF